MIRKLLIGLLITTQAWGAYPPTTIQGQSDATGTTKFNFQVPYNQYTDLGGIKSLIETGNDNLLKNAGFENSTYSTSWTITNSTGALDTTYEVQDKQGASLTLSSQTGDLLTQSVTPTTNFDSQNFEASCRVKTSLTSIQLCAMSNGVEQTCVPVSSNNVSGLVSSNFISSSGTSVGVKIKATSTETGSVYVDDCYVGQARNTKSNSQAILMGSVVITGCSSTWTTTSTTFVTPTAGTSCSYATYGNAQAPSTLIPAIKFASLPAGDYLLQYEGKYGQSTVALNSQYQFSDGTNSARETSSISYGTTNSTSNSINQSISYTAPQSNVTLVVRMKTDSGGTATLHGSTAIPGTIKVWYFPNSAQQSYNTNQLPASWSGYHGTDCSWNRASTTFANYSEDNSCTFTQRTNRNFGTVTSDVVSTGRIPRIMFTPNKAGMYQVCASFSASSATTSNATGYKMVDASSNELIAKINYTAVSGNPNILQMCSIINATNTSQYTVTIQGQAAGVATNYINQNSNSTLDWTIISLDNQFPAPVLVGSVTSNTTSSERIERATVNCSASSSIVRQSGSWISTIGNVATGKCTLTLVSGTFSSAPTCTISSNTSIPSGEQDVQNLQVVSATSIIASERWQASGSTTINNSTTFDSNIICMGAR